MPTLPDRGHRADLGPPTPSEDPRVFSRLSLVALLAWIGLASGSPGPAAALDALRDARGRLHAGLAAGLAAALAIFVVSSVANRIHEPSATGGYAVTSKILGEARSSPPDLGEPDPRLPVAVLFVGGYGGLGRHALLLLLRMFPGHFRGVVFASVAVVDSGTFQGKGEVRALEERTRATLAAYCRFGQALGLPSASACAIGTEVAVEAERLGVDLLRRYPKALVVAGQIIFDEDTLFHRVLHNEAAFMIQRRLQRVGVPMIVLPVQLDLEPYARPRPRRRAIRRTSADIDAEE